MAEVLPEGDLHGFLLPWDLRDATLTATSQAGPRAGVPEADRASSLAVVASGVPSTAEATLVNVARAGGAEPAGGSFRWRHGTGEDWRGWDPPTAMAAWEWLNRSTTTDKWRRPHAARMADGRVVVVAVQDTDTVVAWVQGATGLGTWSSVTIADTGYETCATVDVLPSGRICVWYTAQIATTTTQVHMQYSDDGGATFTSGSSRCLMTPFLADADDIKRLRVRYFNGDAIMLAWYSSGGADYVWQFGSSDGGLNFYPIIEYQTADIGAPDIVVRGAEILVCWIAYDATLLGSSLIVPKIWKIGSVGTPFTSVEGVVAVSSAEAWEWGVYSGGRFTSAELAVLADDDGMIYVYGVDYDAAGTREVRVSRSYDGGTTWQTPLAAPEAVYYSGDTSTYLYDIAVVPEKGRAGLFCRSAASPGTADDSLIAVWLGGYSTRPKPWLQGYPWDQYVAGWDVTYLPLDEPQDTGTTWTAVTVGAPVVTLGSNGLTITQGAGDQKSWYYRPGTVDNNKMGFEVQFQVTAISSGTAVLYLNISDATNHYRLRVTVTSTQITVYDVNAGANVASPTTITTTNRHVYVYLVMQHPSADWTLNNGHVRVVYRTEAPATTGPTPDREWTAVADSTTLQTAAGTVNEIQWGCLADAAGVSFGSVFFNHGASVLDDTVANNGFPTRGRTWCPPTSPTYVGRYGLRLAGSGGSAVIGDTWTVPAGYSYPVTALDPWLSPSPRVGWRSTSDSADQDILWDGVDRGIVAGDLVGLYLDGCNFQTAALYADSGAGTKIADVSMIAASGLGFTRYRGFIRPTGGAGTDADYFWPENSLAGWYWQYASGGTVRKIRGNTAGSFRGVAGLTTYRPIRIELETWDGGDSASGTTGRIIAPRALFVTDIATSTDQLMLRIAAQPTAEDYFTASIVAVGRFEVLSRHWAQSRVVRAVSGVVQTASPSGAVYAARPSPSYAEWEVQWTDGIDQSPIYNGTAPDYLTLGYGSAPPMQVGPAALPTSMLGYLLGPAAERPVALGLAIPRQSSAPTSAAPIRVIEPWATGWAWIATETLQVDTIQGHELSSPDGEVVRVGTLRIREAK